MRRRIYDILQLRYEQQFTQKAVAAQLGVGVRQYRRLQKAALHALALQILEREELHGPRVNSSNDVPLASSSELPESLQWISKLSRDETTRIDQVIDDVGGLISPLVQRQGKSLRIDNALSISAAIHPLVLRQALLNLLNVAVIHSASDEIFLRTSSDNRHVRIEVVSNRADEVQALPEPLAPTELMMAKEMLRYFNGDVTSQLQPDSGAFYAQLRCRAVASIPVLVVDDHADTLNLLQRYMIDTPYELIVVSNPQQAVEQAAAYQPQAILLDVMMPEMDGWDVLSQLKQDERTVHLPVLVCTVLDQSELAHSLGASGFLRKPIARPVLLSALSGYAEASGSGL